MLKANCNFPKFEYLPGFPRPNEIEDTVYSEDDATTLEAAQVQIGLRWVTRKGNISVDPLMWIVNFPCVILSLTDMTTAIQVLW